MCCLSLHAHNKCLGGGTPTKKKLALFPLVLVAILVSLFSVVSQVSAVEFENKSRSEHSLSESTDVALIVLDVSDTASMKDAVLFIQENGGNIIHIYPLHILIGNVPRASYDKLLGERGIEAIYYSVVDPSIVEKYGAVAVFAVDAWNNNFMGQAESKGLTPPPNAEEPPPIAGDALISSTNKSTNDVESAESVHCSGCDALPDAFYILP